MLDKLYAQLANRVQARLDCISRNTSPDIIVDHEARIAKLCEDHLPSGSGFNNGTTLDLDASTGDKLVFDTAYHHMDEHGCYAKWTEHRVYVTPSLIHGIVLRVTGKDHSRIKGYVAAVFYEDLQTRVEL